MQLPAWNKINAKQAYPHDILEVGMWKAMNSALAREQSVQAQIPEYPKKGFYPMISLMPSSRGFNAFRDTWKHDCD